MEGIWESEAEQPTDQGTDVWVHIYHCDPYTGFLNRMVLQQAEIGIYHAGVEVYGEEFSFQYYEDTWNNPQVSGVMRCVPRRMPDYEYQESVNLGPTSLTQEEVDGLLIVLRAEWPACSYHLIHRNCLSFAESLVDLLKPPRPFPAHLKGILNASSNNTHVDAAIDYTWSWLKWYMIRKHALPEDVGLENLRAQELVPVPEPSMWNLLLQPMKACSGQDIVICGPVQSEQMACDADHPRPLVVVSISPSETGDERILTPRIVHQNDPVICEKSRGPR